jgi:CPA2 family monovalent cation:H+ antiporter-2
MIIILPQLNNPAVGLPLLGFSILKAAIFIAAMVILGTRLLPMLMTRIARLGSRELFLLAITAIALGVGYVTYLIGLSFALGAFAAGLVLSESDHGHQALGDIIPLRDMFGLLFFASVGMLLDPRFVLDNLWEVIGLVIVVGVFKGLLLAAIARRFGYGNIVPLAVGFGLFQIGEFSFVLAQVGLSTQSISRDLYSLVLSVTIISMFITPLLSGQTSRLYALKKRKYTHEALETMNIPDDGLNGHVIIVGGGIVGLQVARVLQALGQRFVIIEQDQTKVDQARAEQMPVIYGNASNVTVLDAAGVASACLMLVTMPKVVATRAVITSVRQLNSRLDVVATMPDHGCVACLKDTDVLEFVLPDVETGLEMTRQALLHLNINPIEIHETTEDIRRQVYGHLFEREGGYATLSQLRGADHHFALEWINVPLDAPVVGMTIGQAEIRKTTGASIVGVIRNGTLSSNPMPDTLLLSADLLAVIGTPISLKKIRSLIEAGPPV